MQYVSNHLQYLLMKPVEHDKYVDRDVHSQQR